MSTEVIYSLEIIIFSLAHFSFSTKLTGNGDNFCVRTHSTFQKWTFCVVRQRSEEASSEKQLNVINYEIILRQCVVRSWSSRRLKLHIKLLFFSLDSREKFLDFSSYTAHKFTMHTFIVLGCQAQEDRCMFWDLKRVASLSSCALHVTAGWRMASKRSM